MALGTLAGMKTDLGITGTDATRDAALTAMLASVEAAIKKLCHPYQFEAVTETDYLNAPWNSPWLVLPLVPVRSITSIHYNPLAFGVSANFDSEHLLTAPGDDVTNPDYVLETDMRPEGWSRSGRVRRLNRATWGVQYVRPLARLGSGPEVESRCLKVVYAAGHTSVPADVTQALYLATRLVYERRTGTPLTSEGWNGYSAGYAGPFTATAAVTSPDVYQMLSPYLSPVRVGS